MPQSKCRSSIFESYVAKRYGKRCYARMRIAIIERLLFFFHDAENVTAEARTSSEAPEGSPVHSQSQQQPSQQQPSQQPHQQQQAAAQQYREAQVPRPSQQPSTPEKPAWGYGLDLIGSQASAFWQNYQGQSFNGTLFHPHVIYIVRRFPRCFHGTARVSEPEK